MNNYGEKTSEQDNFNSTTASNDEIRQDSLIEVMLRQRWTIMITVGVILAGTILYLLNATPIFTSIANLYVEQTGAKLIGEYDGVMTNSKNYLNTQGEVIRSTPILAKVAGNSEIQRFNTFSEVDNLLKYLKENIEVHIGKNNDIITISFDSPYPEEAAVVVNEVVEKYIDYHANQKRSTVSEVLRILQKEKVKRDRELSDKFAELLDFTRVNGVITLENRGNNVELQRLSTLSDALTKAELETINARAELEAAIKMAKEPEKLKYLALADLQRAGTVIYNSEDKDIQLKISDLQQKLEEARSRCTGEHPMVVELKTKIATLKEQISTKAETFAHTYIELLQEKLAVCEDREDELLAVFNEQEYEAQSFGLKATQYAVLQSELERTKRLCEILDERIKELNVTEDSGALNINVLEAAQAEDEPSKPQKAKVLALALVAGLLLGGGLGILRDWLDYRLRSVEEISAILNVPVLGVVPKMAANVEESIFARGKHFWQNLKVFVTDGSSKASPQAVAAAAGRGKQSEPNASGQDRWLITQLVMDCGRKMVERLIPVITGACKNIGININHKQSGASNTEVSAESKTKTEPQQESGRKEKGWLESQSTVAQVYQQRLDRALFGKSKKEVRSSRQPITDKISTTSQPDRQTSSGHGLEICNKPRSAVAEAYRTIRTAVFFGVPKDEAKTILVTSPAPGDGKSTLASNLAIAMAQAGQKTLVVDCDFRKPTQQAIFNCNNEKGISNVFAENLPLDQVIQHGPVAGLDIMTRGPEVPNPCELLNSEAFTRIIRKLTERYDRIIIDSAPVIAVADSQILSAISDVSILVLRAEKSTRRLSQQAMHLLQSVGARVLGVVVNGVPVGGGHYGYYYGYGYYGKYGHYGYGSERKNNYYQESAVNTTGSENPNKTEVKV